MSRLIFFLILLVKMIVVSLVGAIWLIGQFVIPTGDSGALEWVCEKFRGYGDEISKRGK